MHARRGPPAPRGVFHQPEPGLCRARLRRRKVRRVLPPALHGHRVSVDDRSRYGAAREACHVDLRAVRALSSQRRLDGCKARGVRRRGGECRRSLRAGVQVAHPAPPGAHARRHRAHHRAQRGEYLRGRAVAGPAVLPATGAGVGQVRNPGARLLSVRRGHAPGRRDHGRVRPPRRAAHPPGRGGGA